MEGHALTEALKKPVLSATNKTAFSYVQSRSEYRTIQKVKKSGR